MLINLVFCLDCSCKCMSSVEIVMHFHLAFNLHFVVPVSLLLFVSTVWALRLQLLVEFHTSLQTTYLLRLTSFSHK